MPTVMVEPLDVETVRQALRHQYLAGLSMLHDAIRRCPDAVWDDPEPSINCCAIACHAAFFTRYFLHPDPDAFRPWPGLPTASVLGAERGGRTSAPDDSMPATTTRDEVLAYVKCVIESLDEALESLDLTSPESGFHGYRMSKLEHQLVNLRQLQHHTARLIDRVRAATGEAVPWLASDRSDTVN